MMLSTGVPLARTVVAWQVAGRKLLAKFCTPPLGTQSLLSST